jgi:hypothetical protein
VRQKPITLTRVESSLISNKLKWRRNVTSTVPKCLKMHHFSNNCRLAKIKAAKCFKWRWTVRDVSMKAESNLKKRLTKPAWNRSFMR